MDAKVFGYFLAVNKYRSFARAAQGLRISPQGLGSALRRLEDELGVPLFSGAYGTGELTEYGAFVLDYARRIDGALGDMRRGIEAMRAHARNVVRLGCSVGLLGYLGERAIDEFNETADGVQVVVSAEEPDLQCERGLAAKTYDLALLVNPPSREFVSIPIVDDYQFFWVGKGNRLSRQAEIRLEDLEGQTVATVDDGFRSTDALLRLMEGRGVHANVVFTGEMMRIYEFARSGRALGLTCRNHIEATAESSKTVGLPFRDLLWGFSLCYRRDHALTEGEALFVDHLRGKRKVFS